MGMIPRMSRKLRIPAVMAGLLLAFAGPVFAQQGDTQSELTYRAALGRADDIKLLIDKGGDPNGANKEGIPLLMVASARKDSEALSAVQALLEGGANVNIKDANGQTALYSAARAGKPEVVDYLLKNNIDYYSLDNNGDIARTIAYRAGRKEIVDIMDNFVKMQTLQVENIAKNADRMVAEQVAEEQRRAELEAKKQQAEFAAIRAKQDEERKRKLAIYNANLEKLGDKVYDISYNSCAFQYWSFSLAANQTMEISDEEVEELIGIHRDAVQETSMEVMKMFNVGQSYVNKIIVPSKQRIYTELASMPSRTWRKENGVGKLTDVHKRCEKVASIWQITVPKQAQQQEQQAQPQNNQKAQPKKNKQRPKKQPRVRYRNQTINHK